MPPPGRKAQFARDPVRDLESMSPGSYGAVSGVVAAMDLAQRYPDRGGVAGAYVIDDLDPDRLMRGMDPLDADVEGHSAIAWARCRR